MPTEYVIFDASEVQLHTRRKVRWVYLSFSFLTVLTLCSLAFVRLGHLSPSALTWGLPIVWLVAGSGLGWQLRRLRRTVWCVKLSEGDIVGYDYARRKTVFAWTEVERIDVRDAGLTIMASPHCFFEISTRFPDFAALSHQAAQHADQHEITLCIDGEPWENLDVYQLYPFLSNEPPADASGATTR